jgi:putative spermidine/putrescine transport system substrate-binding protein
VLGIVGAACGDDDDDAGGAPLEAIGDGEGALNLVVWAGYAEDGSTYPEYDWVHPFQDQTGCVVKSKIAATSDEMFTLMGTGQYDGVSASGDASVRLIDADLVAPVNTDLITNYADLSTFLKDTNYNSSDGTNYGVPHGWGANYLMYNSDVVSPAPDSWGVVFDKSSPYAGNVTAYDAPIYIADAAVYLMSTQPDLGIEDPYSLDQEQFDASVALLKDQHAVIGEYWNDYTKAQAAFESGSTVVGTTWQVIYNLAVANNASLATVYPKEGATGWSDTWMISSEAAHHLTGRAGDGRLLLRSGAGQPQGVRHHRRRPLRRLQGDRRRLRRGGPLLGHAAQGVSRRLRRRLRAVLGVDQGLDRDQGLSESRWGARSGAPPSLTRWKIGSRARARANRRGRYRVGCTGAGACRSRPWQARPRSGWRCSTPVRCCRCSSRRCTR